MCKNWELKDIVGTGLNPNRRCRNCCLWLGKYFSARKYSRCCLCFSLPWLFFVSYAWSKMQKREATGEILVEKWNFKDEIITISACVRIISYSKATQNRVVSNDNISLAHCEIGFYEGSVCVRALARSFSQVFAIRTREIHCKCVCASVNVKVVVLILCSVLAQMKFQRSLEFATVSISVRIHGTFSRNCTAEFAKK